MYKNKIAKSTQKKAKLSPDLRERLLEIGKEHYLHSGFNGISVRKVAKQAQVNLGSFVYYFKNKEIFIQEIVQSYYFDFLTVFNHEILVQDKYDSPLLLLEGLMLTMSEFLAKKGPVVGRLLLDLMEGAAPVQQAMFKELPRHIPVMIGIISDCQKKGLIRRDVEPMMVYVLCMSAVALPQVVMPQICTQMNGNPAKSFSKKILSDEFRKIRIDFALKGLRL